MKRIITGFVLGLTLCTGISYVPEIQAANIQVISGTEWFDTSSRALSAAVYYDGVYQTVGY